MDNARPEIIQLSELGLVELTRRRRGQSLFEIFNDDIKNMNPIELVPSNTLKERTYNVTSIFFQKIFNRSIKLKERSAQVNIDSSSPIAINQIAVNYRYIIPVFLYNFAIGRSVHLS